MLAIAKRLVRYSKDAFASLAAVGAIARWDLTEAAAKVRQVADTLEAEGKEELVKVLDSAVSSIHDSSAVLAAEKEYLQRILVRLEEHLVENGVPLDKAHEIAIAYDSVTSLRRALVNDASLNSLANEERDLGFYFDEAVEALHALAVRVDPWLDEGEPNPALEAYVESILNPTPEWEKELEELERESELDRESDELGFEVVSLEDFYRDAWGEDADYEYFMPSTEDEEDLGTKLASRVMSIGDALADLDDEFPVGLDEKVEQLLDEIFAAYGELEEVVIG